MLHDYLEHIAERKQLGIPPKPLTAEQTQRLIEQLNAAASDVEQTQLIELFTYHVPAGVDEAAKVKAQFLADIVSADMAEQRQSCPLISAEKAIELLATMKGGYNIPPLIAALDSSTLAPLAVNALSHTLLIFEQYEPIVEKFKQGNLYAKQLLTSWAEAEWFLSRPEVAEKMTLTVFKVDGETNTDDLSPAPFAWSRPDIPLHAQSMLSYQRAGIEPDQINNIGPLKTINQLKQHGYPLIYVGDVVGTGSSRKSATNSLLWHIGETIPYQMSQKAGGYVLAGKIAPIFFNTLEDSGALPMEGDVTQLAMGDVVDVYPYKGEIRHHHNNELCGSFALKTDILFDEVRAGGRINLIIGRHLTARARKTLGLPDSQIFRTPAKVPESKAGYTLAQKMVGRACNLPGVRAGQYCEPKISTVGSQDTTGSMTRDELKNLACLSFSSDLVMQSFCHTSAYPKPIDVTLQQTLPDFIAERGGIALKPGDGIIHSWLNRMLIPDTVGTGGDSHTRFPLGISFPAGSGLVAFAAATGSMPLDMPESVLVRFTGQKRPEITLRDLVHAIPYYAIKQGLLTVEKQDKKNIFSGRILEIEGLSDLTAEQAFELADASAERSAAACTVQLSEEQTTLYLRSNIALLKWMVTQGYQNKQTLEKRIEAMEQWLTQPTLLQADKDAEYAAIITINLDDIAEPILCAPNDPDDVRLLSDVENAPIDEVFIGSCMTNIGHFRAAGRLLSQSTEETQSRLWLAPPTRMDADQLMKEGWYNQFIRSGTRIEAPGCSLCMGNQARVRANSHVVSTSTRNFPNRLGTGANVYLASAEIAAITAILGRLPTLTEYQQAMQQVNTEASDIYRYLQFDDMPSYTHPAQIIQTISK